MDELIEVWNEYKNMSYSEKLEWIKKSGIGITLKDEIKEEFRFESVIRVLQSMFDDCIEAFSKESE